MKKVCWTLFAALILIIAGFSGRVFAASSSFTVTPVIPDNQVTNDQGYFNLLLEPGQAQDIQFRLYNSTDKEVTVNTAFSTATTANSGTAVYTAPASSKFDPSLKYKISDNVTLPKSVKIPAKTTVAMTAHIKMPAAKFDGVMAGGFSFQDAAQPKAEKNSGVSIINEYRYVIALLMQQNKNQVAPDLKLGEVGPKQFNDRNVITANLENFKAAYLKDMTAEAHITGLSDKSIKFDSEQGNMKMAPNSNFDFTIPISLQGAMNGSYSEPLKAGKYHMSMTVYGKQDPNGKYEKTIAGVPTKFDYKWVFDRDFEISGQKASELNAKDPTINHKQAIPWLVWAGLAVIIILLGIILFLLLKRRKKDDEEEN